MSSIRILVADVPEGVEALRRAFASSFELLTAATVEEALRHLQDELPAVVVCGCDFDDGRMYDLLRHLKAGGPAMARLPFMAVRCIEGEMALDGALYESVKIAVRALGGNAFVDLLRWERKYGEAEAGHRLTRLIQALAANPHPDSA